MWTIIKIDWDECVHEALNRWFDNEDQAKEFLAKNYDRISNKFPGSEIYGEPGRIEAKLPGKPTAHTEFLVVEAAPDIFA